MWTAISGEFSIFREPIDYRGEAMVRVDFEVRHGYVPKVSKGGGSRHSTGGSITTPVSVSLFPCGVDIQLWTWAAVIHPTLTSGHSMGSLGYYYCVTLV